ncbi:hypothetical protein BC830DRAFT_1173579 [Chytriomyces sp. MP71]|nr:hypothetical protein BC830DRAFT_1173579 [Chytriomyces sp. MP71]
MPTFLTLEHISNAAHATVIDLEEFRDVNGLVPVAVGSENYAPPPSLLTSQRHDSIGSSSMRHSLTSSSSGTQLESILEADARETPPSAVSHALKALNQAAISNLQTRTLNTSSRRQLLGSTRSLVSISEKVTEEEAEADVPQKMTVHTTSAAKLVAHSNFTSSTRSGLLNNSSSRTGLTGSSSFVSGTGLARSAFMSSREALNTMGSNFQLNNIVPEEEEEDEEAPRGEGRIPETKLKGLYGSKSASNIKSVSSLSRGHGLISGMSGVIAERHSPLREYVRQDLEVGDEEDEDTDLIHSGFRDNPSHSSTTFNLLNMDGTHAASKPQSSRKSITVSIPEYDESDSSSSSKLHADKESTFQSEGEPTVYSQSGSQDTLRIYENDIMSKSLQSLSSKDQMMVVFRDLCMTVTTGTKRVFKKRATVGVERQILKNVNGVFLPGRLTAIMGASGAGKV